MTEPSRRGPGRPVGGGRVVDRALLLDAAERVIARDGSGASIEAIAAEVGVSKPTLYAHVGRRSELCDALAERLVDRLVAAARGTVPAGGPSRDGLAAFFRATLETIEANGSLFVYVSRGADGDVAQRTVQLAERSAGPLAELLARWRSRLGADPAVSVPWAYGIIGMVNLVALWWISTGEGTARTLADQLADLVWPGLSQSVGTVKPETYPR